MFAGVLATKIVATYYWQSLLTWSVEWQTILEKKMSNKSKIFETIQANKYFVKVNNNNT